MNVDTLHTSFLSLLLLTIFLTWASAFLTISMCYSICVHFWTWTWHYGFYVIVAQYYVFKGICESHPLTGCGLFFIVVLNSILWICHKLLYKWTFDLFPGSRIPCCYNWCRCNLVAYVCNSSIPEVNARGPEFSVNLKSIVSLKNPVSKTKWHIFSKSTAGVSIPGHASWFPFSCI